MKRLIPLVAVMLLPAAAQAERIAALSGGDRILTFSAANPVATFSNGAVTGLGGDSLVGLDFRASNRTLYGLGSSGAVYSLAQSGSGFAATNLGSITAPLSGSGFEIDFNPVPNRLRVASNANQSLRVNVDAPAGMGGTTVDGSFAYANGAAVAIVGAAYTNNVAGATSTTFYALDAAQDALVVVNPPNVGTLINRQALSGLTLDPNQNVGFDISGVTGRAYVSAGGSLYGLNLGTGAATSLGGFAADVSDITVLSAVPEPRTWAMLIAGFGLVGFAARRRRASVAA